MSIILIHQSRKDMLLLIKINGDCWEAVIDGILGPGRVFLDRTGPAGLAFPTGPDRPVQLQNSTGEKPVRLIY
jgi:hypothetical protein